MFDTIAGLPVHALVVHAVVVLGPLAALMLLAYALRPTWRTGLRWPTLLLSAVAAASAFVATQSGEALEERVGDPAFDHAEKGRPRRDLDVRPPRCGGRGDLPARARRPGRLDLGRGHGRRPRAVAFAVFAVFNAGHSGASSVWKDIVANTTPSGGDD